jgi:DHA1 family inner membrane transport protein
MQQPLPASGTTPGAPSTTALPLPSSTPWLGVGMVVLAGVVASLQVGKVAIAVPQLRTDFGLDLAMVGWLMAMFSLLGVVGAIPVGAWIARAGDRRLLLTGLLAIALGSAIGAMAHGIAALLFGRVIEGFGFVLITIAGPAVLQRVVAPGGKDLAFAIWSCFMPAGIAIALFIGSVLEVRPACRRSSPWCRTPPRTCPARAGRSSSPCGRRTARGSRRPPSAG